ncbi:hypothetical protein QYE76_016686 [Lolium multiflorum]|uniref:Retrotransposon gag domain-containing protein n=1 Tax=Lolium multiflorum TaxID=4521 RepID=A0AAD8PHR9_LOLMU|nr:hypothetical protein QYE76_016686 [Lolium multiflorum]
MNLKRDEFRGLRQGGRTLKEYMDDFCALARYAPEDIDTDAKRKEKFLNGLKGELKIPLSVAAYAPSYQSLLDQAITLDNNINKEENRKRKFSKNHTEPFHKKHHSSEGSGSHNSHKHNGHFSKGNGDNYNGHKHNEGFKGDHSNSHPNGNNGRHNGGNGHQNGNNGQHRRNSGDLSHITCFKCGTHLPAGPACQRRLPPRDVTDPDSISTRRRLNPNRPHLGVRAVRRTPRPPINSPGPRVHFPPPPPPRRQSPLIPRQSARIRRGHPRPPNTAPPPPIAPPRRAAPRSHLHHRREPPPPSPTEPPRHFVAAGLSRLLSPYSRAATSRRPERPASEPLRARAVLGRSCLSVVSSGAGAGATVRGAVLVERSAAKGSWSCTHTLAAVLVAVDAVRRTRSVVHLSRHNPPTPPRHSVPPLQPHANPRHQLLYLGPGTIGSSIHRSRSRLLEAAQGQGSRARVLACGRGRNGHRRSSRARVLACGRGRNGHGRGRSD